MKKFITSILCAFAFLTMNAQSVNNLYVSPTGWAMWDELSNATYQIYLDGELVAEDLTTTFFQHENLVDGQEYTTTVIPVYSDGNGDAANYVWKKVDCNNYAGVTDFVAGMVNNVGFVSWTLPAIYKGDEETKEGSWLHYDNGNFEVPIGLTFDGVNFESFKWGIMFPASDMSEYAGQSITKVSFYDCEAFDGEVFIYEGGSSEPGSLLYSQEFSSTGSLTYMEIELNAAVEVGGSQNIWVVITNYNGKQPAAGCADQGNANGRWIYYEGYGWMDFAMLSMPAYTWQIRAYVEEHQEPVVNEVLGAILYRNGELLSELVTDEHYIDTEAQGGDEYTLRVVYGGEKDYTHYFMACPQTAIIDDTSVDKNEINDVAIYPNPTNGNLNINISTMTNISVFNSLGQMVYDSKVDSDKEVINMSQFDAGVYMIRVTTERDVITKSIIVTK